MARQVESELNLFHLVSLGVSSHRNHIVLLRQMCYSGFASPLACLYGDIAHCNTYANVPLTDAPAPAETQTCFVLKTSNMGEIPPPE